MPKEKGTMRIVGGIYRHRNLFYPEDAEHTRPTKDRVREAVFSALGDISRTSVLDLYAGSGAMGLEALSRGAVHATFVDISKTAVKTTEKNIHSLSIPSGNVTVLETRDFDALSGFRENGESFDVIFLDPPYRLGEYERLQETILQGNILKEHGIIVMESDHPIAYDPSLFLKSREYHYGEILVTILWR